MYYKIILNKHELDRFINWLPSLEQGECYYVCLFARKKYHPSAKNDKANVKRFIATSKTWLYVKLKQLEIPLDCYSNKDGSAVHNDSLALYICPNPRSFLKAQRLALKKLADVLADGLTDMNPAAIGLTSIHKAKSRTIYVDFDFDGVEYNKNTLIDIINTDAYEILFTRNGFHILVKPDKVQKEYNSTWYQKIKALPGCDVVGDSLIPIAGCSQGGFIPRLY